MPLTLHPLMKTSYLFSAVIIIIILLLIDLYTFRGLQLLLQGIQGRIIKISVNIIYWAVTAIIISGILFISFNPNNFRNPAFFTTYVMPLFGAVALFVLPKIIFVFFQMLNDLLQLSLYLISKFTSVSNQSNAGGEIINRRIFLTQTGAILAMIPFVSIAYGMIKGKYDFRILKEKLFFENLPAAFDGLRIVQISDIHIGSFGENYEAVKKGIDMVNSLEPDFIFFTGDLINNFAKETEGWLPHLRELKAKNEKYSILGNHDYGDYVQWDSREEKQQNIQNVIDFHSKIGFRLLLNESVKINRGGEEISLIGVENWGRPPFPKYGDLKKAMTGCEKYPFKILLSHDPSHWDEEVLKKTSVDLTLSGHTHGMQFGVEVGSIKWSPVKFKYPRWGGLYSEGKQFLYVNRGFGFIGFPGRVGMPPEITLIELKKGSV